MSGPGHVGAVDLVRVLTFACVIAVHTVATINPADSVPAGGVLMLLHFTREAFFALTAFVLVYRYRDRLRIVPFWRRRFLLVGVPYVIWSAIYTGLGLITTPLPPTAALIQLGRNLITGTACYHLYFLVVTMQFYLLFPLFLWLLRVTRGWHGWLLALGAVLQAAIDTGLHVAHPSGIAGKLLGYGGSFAGGYVCYFLLGGVVALHAERAQNWVRSHRVAVLVAVLLTGACAEGWYLASVRGGVPILAASDVFQPVMVPWCVAITAALFTLGAEWSARRGTGLGSRVIEISSDRSFGVFLVHPILLWAWSEGLSQWLSTSLSLLWSTVFAYIAVAAVSLLVVELLRRGPLSLALTGKRRSPAGGAVQSSLSAEPIRLGARQV
ncbi:MAG TPA: acyltransferase [Pseudonocardiaceae bacterium]|nr:acyltransferase [Pseudonocardiaceae bacterium]